LTQTYKETFNRGPGGWMGWKSNAEGALALDVVDGELVTRSPWWIDYNHAPPGGGYMNLLYCLHTTEYAYRHPQQRQCGGANHFIEGGYPTDFTGARLTARLRGEVTLRGAQLVLLAQARVGEISVNSVLTAQPLTVTKELSEQSITLDPDPGQWLCMGSRHDRTETYGWGEIGDVLRDLNVDIILVLFPLEVVPVEKLTGDPHKLRAGEEFTADPDRLPCGHVMLDEVRVEFP
jgi:hypothetical protein